MRSRDDTVAWAAAEVGLVVGGGAGGGESGDTGRHLGRVVYTLYSIHVPAGVAVGVVVATGVVVVVAMVVVVVAIKAAARTWGRGARARSRSAGMESAAPESRALVPAASFCAVMYSMHCTRSSGKFAWYGWPHSFSCHNIVPGVVIDPFSALVGSNTSIGTPPFALARSASSFLFCARAFRCVSR